MAIPVTPTPAPTNRINPIQGPVRPGGAPAPPPAQAPPPTLKDIYSGGGTTGTATGNANGSANFSSIPASPKANIPQLDTSNMTQAATDQYNKIVAPQITAQMALSGLGHSTGLANALALGGTQMGTSLAQTQEQAQQANQQAALQQYLGDLSSRTQLGSATIGSNTQKYLGNLGAQQNSIQDMINLGQLNNAQQGQAISALGETGGVEQGNQQASLDAMYNDFLRRAAASQFAVGTPFGGAGSMIGSQTTGKG